MNKKITILTFAFLTSIPLSAVFAEDVSTISTDTNTSTVSEIPTGKAGQVKAGWKNQRAQQQQDKKELAASQETNTDQEKKSPASEKCQRVNERISEKIQRSQNDKKNFAVSLDNMVARLKRLSERLSARNIDVTKLNQDITTLQSKVDKLKQDHDAFFNNLVQTQTATTSCENSQGKFISSLTTARSSMKSVEADRQDIKNFFQTTVRQDIMAIRAQMEKDITDDQSEKVETENDSKVKDLKTINQ